MSGSAPLRRRYLSVWRELLCGWLGWPDDRFAAFVAGYDADLDGRGNPLFYHYDELYFVLWLLIPERLAGELASRRTQSTHYNDLAALEAQIGDAITGRPFLASWGTPGFDWATARERVSAVLREWGAELPTAGRG